jgi:hypothetical protein
VPSAAVLTEVQLEPRLTLILLTWNIGRAPNVSKWQIGFNSAFKGLHAVLNFIQCVSTKTASVV